MTASEDVENSVRQMLPTTPGCGLSLRGIHFASMISCWSCSTPGVELECGPTYRPRLPADTTIDESTFINRACVVQ
jgi:hypothetical protein